MILFSQNSKQSIILYEFDNYYVLIDDNINIYVNLFNNILNVLDAELRIVTKDRDKFKKALNEIVVDGGGDCPEYAMTGIETALAASLPYSYFFVFTDASAKDHKKFESIKSICQKKQSQVLFFFFNILLYTPKLSRCGVKDSVTYTMPI